MGQIDNSVFGQQKSLLDYQQLQQAFEAQKALQMAQIGLYTAKANNPAGSGGNSVFAQSLALIDKDPELSGLDTATKLSIARSGLGQGFTMQNGAINPITGYSAAKGDVKTAEQNATNASDQAFKPVTAGLVENAQNTSKLNFASPIAENTKIGSERAEQSADKVKKSNKANDSLALLDEAEKLLPSATSGGASAMMLGPKAFLGVSDDATKANARLNQIAATLTLNVPRLEGPQSDADRAFYAKAVGDIGNPKLPTGDRVVALQGVRDLQKKYSLGQNLNGSKVALPGDPIIDPQLQDNSANAKKTLKWDDLE